MDLKGEVWLNASKADVWAKLNDPEVLRACIPGCQSLEAASPTSFSASAKIKVGPVTATFKGNVTLSNMNPPEGYTLTGEGEGGLAGFAKGSADVQLSEKDGGTLLVYTARAQIGGKIAQLGARLIDGVAKKTADGFFQSFASFLSQEAPQQTQ